MLADHYSQRSKTTVSLPAFALPALPIPSTHPCQKDLWSMKLCLALYQIPGVGYRREGDIRTLLQLTSAEKQILRDNWNQNTFEQPLRTRPTLLPAHSVFRLLFPPTPCFLWQVPLSWTKDPTQWACQREGKIRPCVNMHSLRPCGSKETRLPHAPPSEPTKFLHTVITTMITVGLFYIVKPAYYLNSFHEKSLQVLLQ